MGSQQQILCCHCSALHRHQIFSALARLVRVGIHLLQTHRYDDQERGAGDAIYGSIYILPDSNLVIAVAPPIGSQPRAHDLREACLVARIGNDAITPRLPIVRRGRRSDARENSIEHDGRRQARSIVADSSPPTQKRMCVLR